MPKKKASPKKQASPKKAAAKQNADAKLKAPLKKKKSEQAAENEIDEVTPEDNEKHDVEEQELAAGSDAEKAAPKKKAKKSAEPVEEKRPVAGCSSEVAAPKKKFKKSAEAEIDEEKPEDKLEDNDQQEHEEKFPIARFRRCRIDVYWNRGTTVGLYCKESKRQAFSMFFGVVRTFALIVSV